MYRGKKNKTNPHFCKDR